MPSKAELILQLPSRTACWWSTLKPPLSGLDRELLIQTIPLCLTTLHMHPFDQNINSKCTHFICIYGHQKKLLLLLGMSFNVWSSQPFPGPVSQTGFLPWIWESFFYHQHTLISLEKWQTFPLFSQPDAILRGEEKEVERCWFFSAFGHDLIQYPTMRFHLFWFYLLIHFPLWMTIIFGTSDVWSTLE